MKLHKCSYCNREINSKERVKLVVVFIDGAYETRVVCGKRCAQILINKNADEQGDENLAHSIRNQILI